MAEGMSAGERLVRERIDEVRRIAAKIIIRDFPGVPYERDDLIQDAVLRILTDAHNYDPARGSFSTFCGAVARTSVLHRLQADKCQCRKPEGGVRSLDEVIWSTSHRYGADIRLMDKIADPVNYEDVCIRREMARNAVRALGNLKDERMRRIICERYLEEPGATYRQLAQELGISRERVRQLEIMAVGALKKAMRWSK